MQEIEGQVQEQTGLELEEPRRTIKARQRHAIGFTTVARTRVSTYPRRTIVGLALFVGQAFLNYILSGVLLVITAFLFEAEALTATTQTLAWCVIFFFASAGASSAYLTVSEIFPMETRAMAISFF